MHDAANSHYRSLIKANYLLVTSNYVVDETVTRLCYDAGLDAALKFRNAMRESMAANKLRVIWVDERCESSAWGILERYRDLSLSMTDAISTAIARDLKITEFFAFDSDFRALGFDARPVLT